MYPQTAAPPQQPTEGFKDLKDITRELVFICNDRVQEFYVTKISEPKPDELKNDLINFISAFSALFLNTSEIMKYKKGAIKVTSNGNEKTIIEWCALADNWLQLEGYEQEVSVYKIFKHGTIIYKAYLACLVKTELFEV